MTNFLEFGAADNMPPCLVRKRGPDTVDIDLRRNLGPADAAPRQEGQSAGKRQGRRDDPHLSSWQDVAGGQLALNRDGRHGVDAVVDDQPQRRDVGLTARAVLVGKLDEPAAAGFLVTIA